MAHSIDAAIDKGMTSILEARLTKTESLMERQFQASTAAMRGLQSLGNASQTLIRQQSDTVQKAAEEILKGFKMVLDLKAQVQQSREQIMDATQQGFSTQTSNITDVKNELASLSLRLGTLSTSPQRINEGNVRLCKSEASSQFQIQQSHERLEQLGSVLTTMVNALNQVQGQSPPLCPDLKGGSFELPLRELARSIWLLCNALRMLVGEFL
jgi:hypothetical protein